MHTQPIEKELLHPKQAAQELGVSPHTVWRHIRQGDLEAVRLGDTGRYRVRREALERFLRPTREGGDHR